MQIDELINICKDVGLALEMKSLEAIKERENNGSCDIILPLVGEFNAGKTTLINSLTDSKQLETDYTPTTASIFEVHFGNSASYATIYFRDGSSQNVEQISSIKNKDLKDALLVAIYDTNNKISPSTILVDTPGLSSQSKLHKEVLVNFMPKADAIFFLVDVHSQITASALEFVKEIAYNTKPIYLVITKKEDKSISEILAMKTKIQNDFPYTFKKIAAVSAKKGDIEEFLSIIDEIERDKKQIIAASNQSKCALIKQSIIKHIDDIMCHVDNDTIIDRKLLEEQKDLKLINKSINDFVSNIEHNSREIGRRITYKFEDVVFDVLDNIVANKKRDYNSEVITSINSLSISLINEYKSEILKEIRSSAAKDNFVSYVLLVCPELELLELNIDNLSLNVDFNAMGHEFDSKIATGVKILATAAVVLGRATAGNCGVDGADMISEDAAPDISGTPINSIKDIAETANTIPPISQAGNILISAKQAQEIEQVSQLFNRASEKYDQFDQLNQEVGYKFGEEKGIIEGIVSLLTDRYVAKAQRRNAVRNYVDGSLSIEFKALIEKNASVIINCVQSVLYNSCEEKRKNILSLRKEQEAQKEEFAAKLNRFETYKKLLSKNN
ncbi:MAG: dynamin family protein [Bacteroidaceae bacterium]|nr:dynamin family protein [Bacteroidaceae bacterium]